MPRQDAPAWDAPPRRAEQRRGRLPLPLAYGGRCQWPDGHRLLSVQARQCPAAAAPALLSCTPLRGQGCRCPRLCPPFLFSPTSRVGPIVCDHTTLLAATAAASSAAAGCCCWHACLRLGAPKQGPLLPRAAAGPSTAASPSTPPTACWSRTTLASTSRGTASTSRWGPHAGRVWRTRDDSCVSPTSRALAQRRQSCCVRALPLSWRISWPLVLARWRGVQDGVEENNTLDHNLAAYVHVIGPVSTAACGALCCLVSASIEHGCLVAQARVQARKSSASSRASQRPSFQW